MTAPAIPGFQEAVTMAFGDPASDLCGLMRVVTPRDASLPGEACAVLVRGGEVALAASGPVEGNPETRIALEVIDPAAAWRATVSGPAAELIVELTVICPLGELHAGSERLEHYCSVRGEGTIAGAPVSLDCFGARGHEWGGLDWNNFAQLTEAAVWLGEDGAIALSAARAAGATGHEDDAVAAAITEAGPEGLIARPVDEPRLSITYDDNCRVQRVGLELWPSAESEFPRRAGGEAFASVMVELAGMRCEHTFLRWRTPGGGEGIGRHELRRAL